ncbi:MAG: methionine/alanine import family NSS transporter small subunit [Fusobacterium sp. JB021]|nr:methionine/alanine import family NSS transporter small subunit [Fusobacterium sp. JB020]MDP0494263.1 methionine/alanine import family NSS transporter small subunit [Fusobacterium sp. JB021]MDP0505748.1 methionine/alanine import family NSS transporter small subunit [Fusobacterium sp. JB019]
MSTGAIIMAILSCVILWGGFAVCLRIALKSNK